jgi:hypothetical protein
LDNDRGIDGLVKQTDEELIDANKSSKGPGGLANNINFVSSIGETGTEPIFEESFLDSDRRGVEQIDDDEELLANAGKSSKEPGGLANNINVSSIGETETGPICESSFFESDRGGVDSPEQTDEELANADKSSKDLRITSTCHLSVAPRSTRNGASSRDRDKN